jgi:hypothetical protein
MRAPLVAEKGPEQAIRIARATRMPLRIAAKIPRAETAYFKKCLEPQIDGEGVRLIGEVKRGLFRDSSFAIGTGQSRPLKAKSPARRRDRKYTRTECNGPT